MNYANRQGARMMREVRAELEREDRLIAERKLAAARKDWATFWAVKRELAEFQRSSNAGQHNPLKTRSTI